MKGNCCTRFCHTRPSQAPSDVLLSEHGRVHRAMKNITVQLDEERIEDGLPEECPNCGEPKEALMYWTED